MTAVPQDAERVSTIRRVLREHRETPGMRVAAGWTCRCGHWASGHAGNHREDHLAAVVAEALREHATESAKRVRTYLDELEQRAANGGGTNPEHIHSFGLGQGSIHLVASDLRAILRAFG